MHALTERVNDAFNAPASLRGLVASEAASLELQHTVQARNSTGNGEARSIRVRVAAGPRQVCR